jgi:hypothetical protein
LKAIVKEDSSGILPLLLCGDVAHLIGTKKKVLMDPDFFFFASHHGIINLRIFGRKGYTAGKPICPLILSLLI